MSLGESLPLEIKRVTEIRDIYLTTQGGQFAAAMMQADIDLAVKALASGDVVAMLQAYGVLTEYEL